MLVLGLRELLAVEVVDCLLLLVLAFRGVLGFDGVCPVKQSGFSETCISLNSLFVLIKSSTSLIYVG